jgi:hypothetical protein
MEQYRISPLCEIRELMAALHEDQVKAPVGRIGVAQLRDPALRFDAALTDYDRRLLHDLGIVV